MKFSEAAKLPESDETGRVDEGEVVSSVDFICPWLYFKIATLRQF